MRERIEIASAALRPRNDGEKWDSPNQHWIPAFAGMTGMMGQSLFFQ